MENTMRYGEDYKKLPVYSVDTGEGVEVRPDVYKFTDQIVNVAFIGPAHAKEFVLVDTGMPKSAENILKAANERFGEDSRVQAILLTHGHFDHVGSVIELAQQWKCPIYAHQNEMPYLTGKSDYPKPDASVEGGLVAKMSPVFPTDAIDLGQNVFTYPEDGTVPYLPDFQWIHVPGHTKGQVAFFREKDRLLISADAFVSTKQENLYAVAAQQLDISGPPRYLTTDWEAARESVVRLQALEPLYVITGHGPVVEGETLKEGLNNLLENWSDQAVPDYGRYVDEKQN